MTGLVVNPVSPHIVYVAFNGIIDPGGGPLYRSTNSGTTWTSINPSILGEGSTRPLLDGITSLDIDPFIPRILYFTNIYREFHRSEDSGMTCRSAKTGLFDGIWRVYAQPDAQFRIYGLGGGSIGGLVMSNNLGDDWFDIGRGSFHDFTSTTNVLSSASLGWAVMVSTSNYGMYRWYTPDGLWERVNNGLGNSLDGMKVRTISLFGQHVFASMDSGVYRTSDVGGSWQAKNKGLNNSPVTCLAVANDDQHTIYAGTGDRANLSGSEEKEGSPGISKSTDGGKSWQQCSNGIKARPYLEDIPNPLSIYGLAVDRKNTKKVYAATSQGLFRSVDGGANWIPTQFWEARSVLVDPVDSGTVITHAVSCSEPDGGYCVSGVWRSRDAGKTWNHLGQEDEWTVNDHTHGMAIGPNSFPVYALTHAGVYKLTAPNGVWTQTGDNFGYCLSAAVDSRSPNVLYVGTTSGIYKSTDWGATWVKLPDPPNTGGWVVSIAIDPLNSDIYVALRNNPDSWTSVDGGKTWHHPRGGLWKSSDGGNTWLDMGLPKNRSVNTVALDPATSSIFSGLEGLGVAVQSNLTRPSRPMQLAAKAISDTSSVLSWLDNSITEVGFRIERKDGVCSSTGTWERIGSTRDDVAIFTDPGLLPDKTYSYRVKAFNRVGDSAYSNCASVTMPSAGVPAAPSNITATSVSDKRVNLEWTDSSNSEALFQVYRKKGSEENHLIDTLPAGTESYSDTRARGNSSQSSYSYDVKACSASGSECSPFTFSALVPLSPTGFVALPSEGGIDLHWADTSDNETGFEIRRKDGGCAESGRWKLLVDLAADLTAYIDTLAFSGQRYSYRVRAYHRSPAPVALGYSLWSNCAEADMP
jgi:hypothetical protein